MTIYIYDSGLLGGSWDLVASYSLADKPTDSLSDWHHIGCRSFKQDCRPSYK